ncbi:uncharacterized protein LY79DRAFT_561380, partial [Colletotrichum navitas]
MCRCQVVHPELFLRPFLFCLGFPRSSSTHAGHGTLVPPTPPSGKHTCVRTITYLHLPHNAQRSHSLAYSLSHCYLLTAAMPSVRV